MFTVVIRNTGVSLRITFPLSCSVTKWGWKVEGLPAIAAFDRETCIPHGIMRMWSGGKRDYKHLNLLVAVICYSWRRMMLLMRDEDVQLNVTFPAHPSYLFFVFIWNSIRWFWFCISEVRTVSESDVVKLLLTVQIKFIFNILVGNQGIINFVSVYIGICVCVPGTLFPFFELYIYIMLCFIIYSWCFHDSISISIICFH